MARVAQRDCAGYVIRILLAEGAPRRRGTGGGEESTGAKSADGRPCIGAAGRTGRGRAVVALAVDPAARWAFVQPRLVAGSPGSHQYAFFDYPEQFRKDIGMVDNLVRLALGLEDVDDLITDLRQALDKI